MAATEISRWLKKHRAKKRQSQLQVAAAVGMSRTWVSGIENGASRPKVEEAFRLAEWAGVEPSEVLSAAGYPLSVIAAIRAGKSPTSTEPTVTLTRADLDAMMERAARRAVQMLREEGWAPNPDDGESSGQPRPSKPGGASPRSPEPIRRERGGRRDPRVDGRLPAQGGGATVPTCR